MQYNTKDKSDKRSNLKAKVEPRPVNERAPKAIFVTSYERYFLSHFFLILHFLLMLLWTLKLYGLPYINIKSLDSSNRIYSFLQQNLYLKTTWTRIGGNFKIAVQL